MRFFSKSKPSSAAVVWQYSAYFLIDFLAAAVEDLSNFMKDKG